MFQISRPNEKEIRRFHEVSKYDLFSYKEIGATQSVLPREYVIDHNRIKIGEGYESFLAARHAVQTWKMHDMSWIELYPSETPIEIGETVVIVMRHFGFWSLNAARIVYVIDHDGEIEKYGFAYGTLSSHGEIGEERFLVEFHHDSNEVWYDLMAFSRPAHWLAKLGYPLVRQLQRRFAFCSKAAMGRAASPQSSE